MNRYIIHNGNIKYCTEQRNINDAISWACEQPWYNMDYDINLIDDYGNVIF
jgi:hypothetical protein